MQFTFEQSIRNRIVSATDGFPIKRRKEKKRDRLCCSAIVRERSESEADKSQVRVPRDTLRGGERIK